MLSQLGISKLDLKRQNRMHILNVLKQSGPSSRIDIAAKLKITRAAITIITNEMISQGIIFELGEMQYINKKAPKGRKKILLDLNQNYKYTFGIFVDEKHISIGLSTLKGVPINKQNVPMDDTMSQEAVTEFIFSSYKEFLKSSCLEEKDVLGIGVAILPHVMDKLNITTLADGSRDYSALYQTALEHTKVPILIDNSILGLAYANIDFRPNTRRDYKSFVFLQYGDNLNHIYISSNEPIESFNKRTHLTEYIIVNPNGEKFDGFPCGSCKAELTPCAIFRKLQRVYSKEKTPILYDLVKGDFQNITLPIFIEAALSGDAIVLEIAKSIGGMAATLVNNLYYVGRPDGIILQDLPLSEKSYPLFEKLIKETCGEDLSKVVEESIISKEDLFLGGCALAIREFLYKRGGYMI